MIWFELGNRVFVHQHEWHDFETYFSNKNCFQVKLRGRLCCQGLVQPRGVCIRPFNFDQIPERIRPLQGTLRRIHSCSKVSLIRNLSNVLTKKIPQGIRPSQGNLRGIHSRTEVSLIVRLKNLIWIPWWVNRKILRGANILKFTFRNALSNSDQETLSH